MSLDILLAGNWKLSFHEKAMANGLRSAGANVIPFKYKSFFDGSLRYKVERKLKKGCIVSSINEHLIRISSNTNPDIIFLHRPVFIYGKTIKAIKKNLSNVLVVTYNNDNPFYKSRVNTWKNPNWLKWYRYFNCATESHVNFFYRPSNLKKATNEKIPNPELLLPYYVKGFHQPHEYDVSNSPQVVFIGHYEQDGRLKHLEALKESGVNVDIFGQRWNEAGSSGVFDLNKISPVFGENYVKTISASNIGLSFLSSLNNDVYTRRCFEIPACGTALISEKSWALNYFFDEGKEAFFFESPSELVDIVQRLLADSSLLRETTNRGRERVIKDGHDHISRMSYVYDVLLYYLDVIHR